MKEWPRRRLRYADSNPLQFGLRFMIGLVVGSAIILAAFQHLGVIFATLLAIIMILATVGVRIQDWAWRLVVWTWAAALAILLQLPWSYGWTLPLFGVVPGLPDDFVLQSVEVAGITLAIIGAALAVTSLIIGSFVQRVICLPPALLLLLLLYSIVASMIL